MNTRIFRGWWVVAACFVIAVFAWSLCLYGASVYLPALQQRSGLPISVIASGVTAYYILSACVQVLVGGTIDRLGPAPVLGFGAVAMASGVVLLGRAQSASAITVAFLILGSGWSCLSATALSTTLAPWFEKHQGRAVTIALMGASFGGMLGAPLLLAGIARFGFELSTRLAGALTLLVLLPLIFFVLRQRPAELGLLPDGADPSKEPTPSAKLAASTPAPPAPRVWTRAEALRTRALRTIILAFGIALMVQIGYITHQVSLLVPVLGTAAAAGTVTAGALAGLFGRMGLARFSDQMDVRLIAVGVLCVSALSMLAMSVFPTAVGLLVASLVYGLMLGNVTTLPPLLVRREFGAASYGRIYGMAATIILLLASVGPTVFGLLREQTGNYERALALASLATFLAAALVWFGRPPSPVLSTKVRPS